MNITSIYLTIFNFTQLLLQWNSEKYFSILFKIIFGCLWRKLYVEYIVKFRCMTHLEQQIEEYERVEQEKMKERHIANKKFLERMRQDESMQQFDG